MGIVDAVTEQPRLVAFDRDGVINELWRNPDLGLVDSPLIPEQVRLTAQAVDAIAHLNRRGIACVVVSNQPAVAKGKTSRRNLDAVTEEIRRQLRDNGAQIDDFYYCLHHPGATVADLRIDCGCRKPKPGLLLRACADLGVPPSSSWFVGDTPTDVQAGTAAGIRTVWIGAVRCDVCPGRNGPAPDHIATDLLDAIGQILGEELSTTASR